MSAPAISTLTATPVAINVGQSAALNWAVSGLGLSVSLNQGLGAVGASGSRVVAPATTTTYTLTASNVAGTRTATCTVTVNQPPTFSSGTLPPLPAFDAQTATSIPLTATATDPENDPFTYSATGLPAGLTYDPNTHLLSGKVASPGTYSFTYSATDSKGAKGSATGTLTVKSTPAFAGGLLPVIPAFDAEQSVSIQLPAATDPDNDTLTYAASGLPPGLSFNSGTRTLNGAVSVPGAYSFTYTATDSLGGRGSATGTLNVQAAGIVPPAGSTATISYDYDSQGRLATLTYPSGRAVVYSYDTLDRVKKVAQNGQNVMRDIPGEYDAWGNPILRQYGSGATDTWSYDPSGTQLAQWTIGPTSGFPDPRYYSYDKADRLTKAGEWDSLAYDANSRLTQAVGFGLTDILVHDAYNNNISTLTTSTGALPPTMNNYAFNPMADNHLPGLAVNGGITQVSEDNFGEITNLGTGISSSNALSMTWDGLGRMTSTSIGGSVESHGYTASGLRMVRQDSLNPQLNRLYAYASAGQLLSEYTTNPSPVWTRDVIYLGNQAIAEVDVNGVHELHSDHLGSPRVITSAAGTVEGTQAYGPYGELLTNFTSGYVPLTGYTGHLQTEPTGLIYMRGRFYSPAWHRFMNSNQGVDPNLLNQFAYTIGNPLMDTDPTGMDNCPNTDGRSSESRAKGGVGRGGDMSGEHGGDSGHSSLEGKEGGIAAGERAAQQLHDLLKEDAAKLEAQQEFNLALFGSVAPPTVKIHGGTFHFAGVTGDAKWGGLFHGVIHESDTELGDTTGSLSEAWGQAEVVGAGLGKVTTKGNPLEGTFGFVDAGESLGPIAGVHVGLAGSLGKNGWAGAYVEGHAGPFGFGFGGYLR